MKVRWNNEKKIKIYHFLSALNSRNRVDKFRIRKEKMKNKQTKIECE
jgi:hypothetical protein